MPVFHPYPYWWGDATTVHISVLPTGGATFAVGDVEFLPYGVAFPDNEGAGWFAGVIPWSQVVNIYKAS